MKLILILSTLLVFNLHVFGQELFKNSFSVDALFGYTVSKNNFNDKLLDQNGNYYPNPQLHSNYYMHVGAKLASKFFLGGSDTFKSGIAVDWFEFSMNFDPSNAGSTFTKGPKLFEIANVGYAGMYQLKHNLGLAGSFTFGFTFSKHDAFTNTQLGLGFNPEVKLVYRGLSVGMRYSRIQGFGIQEEIGHYNMTSLMLGYRF